MLSTYFVLLFFTSFHTLDKVAEIQKSHGHQTCEENL